MSIHYLIDPFTTNGDIIDVVTAENGQTESTGTTIVRVPDSVSIQDGPATLNDLITEKYDGLLASYPGFTEIVADSCLDDLTFDAANSDRVLFSSGFVNHTFLKQFSVMQTTSIPLPFAPTVCVVVWEEYSFTATDDIDERYRRTYVEGPGDDLGCLVSFDGGVSGNFVNNGQVFNIPVPDQGTDLVVAFANGASDRRHLGSWSVIF